MLDKKTKKIPSDLYHFCLSYQDLLTLITILKKYDKFPPLIVKNINYLLSYTKNEISDKIKPIDLEKYFFIYFNKIKKEQSIENILQIFTKNENDIFKKFINYLILHEIDTELLDEFSHHSQDNNLIKQKPKLVNKDYIFILKI